MCSYLVLSFLTSRSERDAREKPAVQLSPNMTARPSQPRPLKFRQLPGLYAIVRQPPKAPVPTWATTAAFTSISRTAEELSIVCPSDNIPKEFSAAPCWICLKLEGPFPFSQTGILLSFIAPLSNNAIPIFAISTYDTDYVLVPQEHADRALDLLSEAGHELITG